MKAAIYARVSTQGQAEDELPIDSQLAECRKYATEHSWQITETYQDAGFSGRTDDRPEFQKMFARAKEKPRPFDIILIWRSNRLFRSVEHRLAYSKLFKRYGIKLVSLHEPEFAGASAMLVETMFAAFDEYFALVTAEDTKRSLMELARQGFSTGGRPPTGYRNVRKPVGLKPNGEPIMRTTWEPDPVMSPKLLRAFEMCAAGNTNVEIVQETHLVAAKNGLSTLLRNRAYLGERIYNTTRRLGANEKKTRRAKTGAEEVVTTLNSHPPIVTVELFNKVQAILDKKRPRRQGRHLVSPKHYILSGLLWCKTHDCAYSGQTTGERYYYSCAMRKKLGKKAVPCVWFKKDAIEKHIVGIILVQNRFSG